MLVACTWDVETRMERGRQGNTTEGHLWMIKALFNPCVLMFFTFLESWPDPVSWFGVPYAQQNWQTYLNASWVTLDGRRSPSKPSPLMMLLQRVWLSPKAAVLELTRVYSEAAEVNSLLKVALTISWLTRHRPWTQMSFVSVPQGVPSATLSFSW